ncbi:MAG: hypothetical protein GEU83_17470 [Pseudonocardiaceae bacterium]|nr:hypothetical protein [Pseudonocardiaceae bacterium]
MDAALHTDLAEFAALTRPLLEADPVRHTVALTVIATRLRVEHTGDEPPVLAVRPRFGRAGRRGAVYPTAGG